MLAGRAVQPLLRCVAVWNELQSVIVGIEKAGPLLKLPRVQERSQPAWTKGPMDIRFSGVSFHHDQDSRKILDKVSIAVPAGSILAITGRDGVGKSTFADLICGYLPNYSGEISIGGFDPRKDGASLKQYLAIVRPGASMMRGTIMDNLIMFRKGDEIELAIHAARLIGLDAQISKLPLGYQTVMSEGPSAELPAGLVQRIAIARAIARRPAVMILDEANGALDMNSDQLLTSGLRRLKGFTTTVIITNRPSFAAIADETWRLEAGKLALVPPISASLPHRLQPRQCHERNSIPGRRTTSDSGRATQDRRGFRPWRLTSPFRIAPGLLSCVVPIAEAVGWRGTPRQIAEALPHETLVNDGGMFRTVLLRLGIETGKINVPARGFVTSIVLASWSTGATGLFSSSP